MWSKSGQNKTLKNPAKFKDFSIDYPEGRSPRVRFRDPKSGKILNNIKISIFELNKLLSSPLNRIETESDCELIASLGIREGIREKLCSKERKKGEKIESIRLKDFVLQYWDYENSPYLKKERELRGKEKSPDYCKKHIGSYITHCDSILGDIRIDEFTPRLMEDIQLSMKESGKANKTIQQATDTIRIPLKEAYREGIIKDNVADRISFKCSSNPKERGILTEDESKRLLKHLRDTTLPLTWDRWRYLAFSIGYYTGMREGEILALKAEDLDTTNNIINVNHSYQFDEKRLKCPKNGDKRYTMPIPPELMKELVEHASLNEGGFIFFGQHDRNKPINGKSVTKTLYTALKAIGITDEERRKRNIVFHSIRHYVATKLIDEGLSLENVEKALGHKTIAMTKHYSNHETEEGKKKFIEATKGKIQYI